MVIIVFNLQYYAMQVSVVLVVTVAEVYSVVMVTCQVKVTRENVFSCQ